MHSIHMGNLRANRRWALSALGYSFALLIASCVDDEQDPIVDPDPPYVCDCVVQLTSPDEQAVAHLETRRATYGEILSVTECDVTSPTPDFCPERSAWHDLFVVEQAVVEAFGPGDEVTGTVRVLLSAADHDLRSLPDRVGESFVLFAEETPAALTSSPPDVALACGAAPTHIARAAYLLDVAEGAAHDDARTLLREAEGGDAVVESKLSHLVWVDHDAGPEGCEE